jgi:hypothetical protein
VVDTLEDDSAFPLALYNDSEALGEGPVLEPLESLFRSLKRLPINRGNKVGRGEGFGGNGNLRCQQRGHRGGYV